MFEKIQQTIQRVEQCTIPQQRMDLLEQIAKEINSKHEKHPDLNLCFICTHNSRRSQLAQVWAETLKHHFGLEISSFSGGTEVTEFNSNALLALENQGFKIEVESEGNNPVLVSYDSETVPVTCFSKTWDNSFNPQQDRIALMTCAEADADCPIVHGALQRFALRYEDPKHFDNTSQQQSAYVACADQIAGELHYLFARIKPQS